MLLFWWVAVAQIIEQSSTNSRTSGSSQFHLNVMVSLDKTLNPLSITDMHCLAAVQQIKQMKFKDVNHWEPDSVASTTLKDMHTVAVYMTYIMVKLLLPSAS